ncbi:MAG: CapA family protein [Candidatus Moraniibacteriota bacterium]
MNLPKNSFLFLMLIVIFALTIFLGGVFFNNPSKSLNSFMPKKENTKNKEVANSDKQLLGEAKILFAGDLMLDRYNRKIMTNKGFQYFTKDMGEIFQTADLNVVNLEGPVTDNQSLAIDTEMENPAHFKFTFDKATKSFLLYNRINLVNLGNNHILNFGEEGATQTVDFLAENKIGYIGSPLDEHNTYSEREINGLKIALVSYNRFYKLGSENTAAKIREAKNKNDIVIVYAHWGNEYDLNMSDAQRDIAHKFIDSGADIIIGSHPHVVQPIEIYQNKAIFYSLGNFVFDQYFSENVKEELIVMISLKKNRWDFSLVPLHQAAGGELAMNDSAWREKLLGRLSQDSLVNDSIKSQIKAGSFFLENSLKK